MIKKNILVCPLDWGLGHAARCIPIIRKLCAAGHYVIIGASGRPAELLKKEFPNLEHIDFKGNRITYGKTIPLPLQIFFLLPFIFAGIADEHRRLKKIIRQRKIDIVISDNRFGLWNRQVKTIYITHQLFIKAGGIFSVFDGWLRRINYSYIRRYNECWVPDFPDGDTLSGELSHGSPLPNNVKFIGPLSRFNTRQKEIEGKQISVSFVISGPEPQRTVFEKLALKSVSAGEVDACIICGKSEDKSEPVWIGNVVIYPFLGGEELQDIIQRSQLIIARSGYTTIMDIACLNKRAVFIPTPGQAEQEYLSKYLMEKKLFFSMTQNEFELTTAIKKAAEYTGVNVSNTEHLLDKALADLLMK